MSENNAVVIGSLSDVAVRQGATIAESFIGAEAVILVDVSASMSEHDSRNGLSRYDVALEELAALQRDLPGKIAVIAFSDYALFIPGGQPPFMATNTNVATALQFAKVADVPGIRFFLISDGEPDNAAEALAVARTFKARIDTIFVGPEWAPHGRRFLQDLAAVANGQSVTAERVQALAAKTETLLLGAKGARDNAPKAAKQRSVDPMFR